MSLREWLQETKHKETFRAKLSYKGNEDSFSAVTAIRASIASPKQPFSWFNSHFQKFCAAIYWRPKKYIVTNVS